MADSIDLAGKNIVAVYAHPDDGEFHAAGSLAKWARAGAKVYAICATDGTLGSKRGDVTRQALAATRAAELGRAMEAVGGAPPIMLGFPDGALREHAAALRERLVYWFRKLAPLRVLTFDPWKKYEIHPDHIEAGRIASEASVLSCFPLLHPEHLEGAVTAAQPSEVWYMAPQEHKPNRVVDVGATLQVKLTSLLCHLSQVEMLGDWFVPGADPTKLTDADTARLRAGATDFLDKMARAEAKFAKGVEHGESFYAQRCGPGHFDNYKDMMMEALGAPAVDAEVH